MAPTRSPPSALIFDLDGTLVDSFELAYGATNVVLQRLGFNAVSEAEYLEGCKYCTWERLARHAGLVPGDSEFESLGIELGSDFDATYIGQVSVETAPLFQNMRRLIERASACGLLLGCVTNAAVGYAEAVLAVHGLRASFGSVHGADSVAKPKPAPDGLLACCAELGVAPERAVYVGDSPTDGAAARAAYFAASLGVAWPGASRTTRDALLAASGDVFDLVLDNIDDLEYALFVGPSGGSDKSDYAAFVANLLPVTATAEES